MTNFEAYTEMMNDMVDIFFVFDVAKENKIADINNFKNVLISSEKDMVNVANSGFVKVKVAKGRKWKGEGYLVGTIEKSFCTGYRNIYTTYGKIFDPSTNRIESIALKNVVVVDSSALFEAYKKNIIENINKAELSEITINAINFSRIPAPILPLLNSFGIDILKEIENALKAKVMDMSSWIYRNGNSIKNTELNLENAIDEEEDYKKAKKAEFKAKKMLELIEWVKNNTDKKGEEINKLAECIFNKKYGKY